MKKVLFVATVYTHLANFHKPYMKMFQDNGYEVHALANSNEGRMNEIEELGVTCHNFEFSRNVLSRDNLRNLKKLSNILNDDYDLIHTHTPIASFISRYVLRKNKRTKVVYTAHGFHFFSGAPIKNWLFFYLAEKIARKWTDALIVINEEDLNNAIRMGYIENENVFYIKGVGVDKILFHRNLHKRYVRKELSIPEDAFIFTIVAELNENKNQEFILRNWDNIYTKNKNAYLLLIGHGKNEEKYKEYINQYKLKQAMVLGFRKDIPNILNESNVALLLSKREGLPKSLMEALSLGKPIIATNVRGNRDIVKHGYNGFLINLDDDDDLRLKCETLIENKSLIKKLEYNATKSFEQFEIKNVMSSYKEIYEGLLRITLNTEKQQQ